MTQNRTPPPLKNARTRAAARDLAAPLVAEDRLTDAAIAARAGVSRRTLARWKKEPAFAARVGELRARILERWHREATRALERRVRRMGERELMRELRRAWVRRGRR